MRILGSAEAIEWGVLANEYPPVLHTHDRYGNRRDEVTFHPAWHNLMRLAVGHGLHNLPWSGAPKGGHVARSALAMLASENEAGHVCPISMTYAAVPVLRREAGLGREWEPRILSRVYDASFSPAAGKSGALIGMSMTERQGGSDVRANTTRAEAAGGGEYHIEGQIEKFLENVPRVRDESGARRLAETLAVALQASLLLRHSPSPMAEASLTSRGDPGGSET